MPHQKQSASAVATVLVPPDIRELLGPSPVVWSEQEAEFNRLFERLAAEKMPETLMEWIEVHDIAVALWQERRVRSLRTALVKQGTAAAAGELLGGRKEKLLKFGRAHVDPSVRLAAEVDVLVATSQGAQRNLKRRLKRYGLTEHDLAARSYANDLNIHHVLNAEQDRAQRRREKLIKDYDRRNQALGTRRKRNSALTLPVIANATEP